MIVLFRDTPRRTVDASWGLDVTARVLPRSPNPPPYSLPSPPPTPLPSLSWICLQLLARYGHDQIVLDGARLHYDPACSDILPDTKDVVDPRLWVTLVQIYDNLPESMYTHKLPLADTYVPLLQRLPSTPYFTLITVLDLPRCSRLTDRSISALKPLHALVALDASETKLSAYGIDALSDTLQWVDDTTVRRGPWRLRILRLRNCRHMNNAVSSSLLRFPLLSILDLRGTACTSSIGGEIAFRQSDINQLFWPYSLASSVNHLSSLAQPEELYGSGGVYTLNITSLEHTAPHPLYTSLVMGNSMHLDEDSNTRLQAIHYRREKGNGRSWRSKDEGFYDYRQGMEGFRNECSEGWQSEDDYNSDGDDEEEISEEDDQDDDDEHSDTEVYSEDAEDDERLEFYDEDEELGEVERRYGFERNIYREERELFVKSISSQAVPPSHESTPIAGRSLPLPNIREKTEMSLSDVLSAPLSSLRCPSPRCQTPINSALGTFETTTPMLPSPNASLTFASQSEDSPSDISNPPASGSTFHSTTSTGLLNISSPSLALTPSTSHSHLLLGTIGDHTSEAHESAFALSSMSIPLAETQSQARLALLHSSPSSTSSSYMDPVLLVEAPSKVNAPLPPVSSTRLNTEPSSSVPPHTMETASSVLPHATETASGTLAAASTTTSPSQRIDTSLHSLNGSDGNTESGFLTLGSEFLPIREPSIVPQEVGVPPSSFYGPRTRMEPRHRDDHEAYYCSDSPFFQTEKVQGQHLMLVRARGMVDCSVLERLGRPVTVLSRSRIGEKRKGPESACVDRARLNGKFQEELRRQREKGGEKEKYGLNGLMTEGRIEALRESAKRRMLVRPGGAEARKEGNGISSGNGNPFKRTTSLGPGAGEVKMKVSLKPISKIPVPVFPTGDLKNVGEKQEKREKIMIKEDVRTNNGVGFCEPFFGSSKATESKGTGFRPPFTIAKSAKGPFGEIDVDLLKKRKSFGEDGGRSSKKVKTSTSVLERSLVLTPKKCLDKEMAIGKATLLSAQKKGSGVTTGPGKDAKKQRRKSAPVGTGGAGGSFDWAAWGKAGKS